MKGSFTKLLPALVLLVTSIQANALTIYCLIQITDNNPIQITLKKNEVPVGDAFYYELIDHDNKLYKILTASPNIARYYLNQIDLNLGTIQFQSPEAIPAQFEMDVIGLNQSPGRATCRVTN